MKEFTDYKEAAAYVEGLAAKFRITIRERKGWDDAREPVRLRMDIVSLSGGQPIEFDYQAGISHLKNAKSHPDDLYAPNNRTYVADARKYLEQGASGRLTEYAHKGLDLLRASFEPEAADVLCCLLQDASAADEYRSWQEWFDEMGCTPGDFETWEEAEKERLRMETAWKTCHALRIMFRQVLGDEGFQDAVSAARSM